VHFLLMPSCHGVVGAFVCLLLKSMCLGLIYMADRWA
jgi:hypothetical protein